MRTGRLEWRKAGVFFGKDAQRARVRVVTKAPEYGTMAQKRKEDPRMEPLIKFWLFLCHWVEFDTFENEEDLDDTIETLTRAGLPYKSRTRRSKAGGEELVL